MKAMPSAMIFLIIGLLVLFGGLAAVLLLVLKKTDPRNNDTTSNPALTEAQGFLPFTDIAANMICLPNELYRMVIECSCVNYNLKTEEERDQIELSFHRFLNSINFPVTFFLQTKTIDNRDRLASLDKSIAEVVDIYPAVKTYAERYRKEMETLTEQIGNSHQKKRYIIVSYDDAGQLDSLSKEERIAYARKELMNRCNMLISGLEGVGVNATVLDTNALIELVYSVYWRDDFSYADAIASKDAFTLFVDGTEDRFAGMSKEDVLRLLCTETMNRITAENLDTTDSGVKMMEFLATMKGESHE